MRTEVSERFVVATGSRAVAPTIAGLKAVGHFKHANVFGARASPQPRWARPRGRADNDQPHSPSFVDDALRTSQPHVFAVGDCAGGPQFTHRAEYEARLATRNTLFRGIERRSMRLVPWVTFTDPDVARVGMTEEEARSRAGSGVHAHRFPFARVDRALTEGEASGFAKVVVDRKERILGAHLIGPDAGEALAEWVVAMQHGHRLSDVGRAIHVYPTMGRINRHVADEVFLERGLPSWMLRLGARFSPQRQGPS